MLFPKLQSGPLPAASRVLRSTVGWAPSCQHRSGCPAPSVIPASEHTFVFTSFTGPSCGTTREDTSERPVFQPGTPTCSVAPLSPGGAGLAPGRALCCPPANLHLLGMWDS